MISSGGISREDIEGIDAYVNVLLTASTPSIVKASSNVSSITDRGVGAYTINFGTALASANYIGVANCISNDKTLFEDVGVSKTTTAYPAGQTNGGGTRTDASFGLAILGA